MPPLACCNCLCYPRVDWHGLTVYDGFGDPAKTEYNSILADVDYLHGLAESFLTITNLLIVNAFRKAVLKGEHGGNGGEGAATTGNVKERDPL